MKPTIQPILEYLPKWTALHDILLETNSGSSQGPILVVCKELFLSTQLELALHGKSCFQHPFNSQNLTFADPEQLMKQLFDEYLIFRQQAEANDTYGGRSRKVYSNQQSKMSLYARRDLMKMIPESATPTEVCALEEATGRVKTNKKPQKRKQNRESEHQEATEDQIEEEVSGRPSLLYDKDLLESNRTAELLEKVQFHALDSQEESILWKTKPQTIILYHVEVGFIRQIEVYQAENPGIQLKVYLLYYDQSIEKTKYEVSVNRETEAFAELIQHKGRIMIPTDLDGDPVESLEDTASLGLEGSNALTRKGGIPALLTPKRKIIVDMREFMSKLPGILHKHNFDLIPMTLEARTDKILKIQSFLCRLEIIFWLQK